MESSRQEAARPARNSSPPPPVSPASSPAPGLVLPAAEDQGRCLRAVLHTRPDLPALHPDTVHPALCLHSETGQDLTYLSHQGWNLYFDGMKFYRPPATRRVDDDKPWTEGADEAQPGGQVVGGAGGDGVKAEEPGGGRSLVLPEAAEQWGRRSRLALPPAGLGPALHLLRRAQGPSPAACSITASWRSRAAGGRWPPPSPATASATEPGHQAVNGVSPRSRPEVPRISSALSASSLSLSSIPDLKR